MNAEIVGLLGQHQGMDRISLPQNNADRNMGRTRYERRCTCGAPMPWATNEAEPAHRAHLASVLEAWVGERERAAGEDPIRVELTLLRSVYERAAKELQGKPRSTGKRAVYLRVIADLRNILDYRADKEGDS